MDNKSKTRCSIERHPIDGGVLLIGAGTCDKGHASVARSIIRGYVRADADFILFDVTDVKFISVDDLKDICRDIKSTNSNMILISPDPKVRKELEPIACDIGCPIADNLEEALKMVGKHAA